MSDVDELARVLKERFSGVSYRGDYGWPHPALNVIDCILSLNRRYNSFVVPRVTNFAPRRPTIVGLSHLRELMDSFENPLHFSIEELNYNDGPRAETLQGVIDYLVDAQQDYEGGTERERLERWASSVGPGDSFMVGVKGFGLAGFQYMRMLFGIQTTKPDVHIRRFVSEVIGRTVNDYTALALLERAAKREGLLLREVDGAIWAERARK